MRDQNGGSCFSRIISRRSDVSVGRISHNKLGVAIKLMSRRVCVRVISVALMTARPTRGANLSFFAHRSVNKWGQLNFEASCARARLITARHRGLCYVSLLARRESFILFSRDSPAKNIFTYTQRAHSTRSNILGGALLSI